MQSPYFHLSHASPSLPLLHYSFLRAMAIFANCVFFIKVKYLPIQGKSRLKVSIKENGGVVNFVLNHKTTHVLVNTADVLCCHDLKNIQKYQLPVLCADFIWKSVEKGELLQIDAYKVNKSQGDASDQRPLIADVEDLSSAENKNATKKNANNSNLTVTEDSERRIESKVSTLTFYSENDQDTPFFPQDFEVAKYSVLEKVNSKESKDFVVTELQCSQEHYKFPFLCARFSASNVTKNDKQFVTNTAEEIREKYKSFIADLKSQDFLLRDFPPEAESVASTKLQKLLLEEAIHSSAVCQEVSDFVELIWAGAVGHLDSLLLESVNNISLNDMSKAEVILLQVKNSLDEGAGEVALQEMVVEFYQVIRHETETDYKVSKKLIPRKQDLCQVTFPDCCSSIKYSSPSEMDGTRLLAVCDFYDSMWHLGSCSDSYEQDYSLNNAPSGYDSGRGVRKTADISSDFEGDEYVVYKTCQIIRYVAKFCLAEDQKKTFQPADEHGYSLGIVVTETCLTGLVFSTFIQRVKKDRKQLLLMQMSCRLNIFPGVPFRFFFLFSLFSGFSVDMSIEMPSSIERIHSWTHKLKIKKTNCKAVIKTVENSSLDISTFVLDIWISHVYLPRMWVEKHPKKMSEACMLVFQPELETAFEEEQLSSKIIILLDCLNSMAGSALHQAKQIALRVLELFCFRQRVNVVKFGTNFTEFSSFSMNITNDLASLKVITALQEQSRCFVTTEKERIQQRIELTSVNWKEIFALQNQDGSWNLSPQLGKILTLDVDHLINNFLIRKGIQSLGPNVKEKLLQLIATLLVLQSICCTKELKGIVFKTLMKLDDSSNSRCAFK
ncbi:LOW QUALITY PROTEIN: protein mono-ADP-ribosyltransferase PARP4 [Morphnus guianensis]